MPCTCRQPAFCERYHGLPASPDEMLALLPKATDRAALYEAYNNAKSGDERVDAFRALTFPFNSY
jgi:hypothetical protein